MLDGKTPLDVAVAGSMHENILSSSKRGCPSLLLSNIQSEMEGRDCIDVSLYKPREYSYGFTMVAADTHRFAIGVAKTAKSTRIYSSVVHRLIAF